MLNQIYIHYITTLFVLESFIISCWLLKGKKIGIGIGIGQFAQKKSVSESATKNHDRASLRSITKMIQTIRVIMKARWMSWHKQLNCFKCYCLNSVLTCTGVVHFDNFDCLNILNPWILNQILMCSFLLWWKQMWFIWVELWIVWNQVIQLWFQFLLSQLSTTLLCNSHLD